MALLFANHRPVLSGFPEATTMAASALLLVLVVVTGALAEAVVVDVVLADPQPAIAADAISASAARDARDIPSSHGWLKLDVLGQDPTPFVWLQMVVGGDLLVNAPETENELETRTMHMLTEAKSSVTVTLWEIGFPGGDIYVHILLLLI
jgi:hypothetical protein